MAESKGSKRYGHGPKIADKGSKSEGTEHKDTKPVEKEGSAPKGSVTSGTDGADMKEKKVEQPQKEETVPGLKETTTPEMSTHERQSAELKDMHDRHSKEVTSMHERHAEDHKKMGKRHHEERTAALPESMAPANTAVEGV